MGRAPLVSLDLFGLKKALDEKGNKATVNDDLTRLAKPTSSFTHTTKGFWSPPTAGGLGTSAEVSMTFQGCCTQRNVTGSDNQYSLFPSNGMSGSSAAVNNDEQRDDQVSGKSSAFSERSPLKKPLEKLTEEDIRQLTREDCRRYLKEKGMRRPSWNKSQAIQQVLSLKGLIDSNGNEEKRPDHAYGSSVEATPAESVHMRGTLPARSLQRAAAEKQTLSSMQQVFPSHNMNTVFEEQLLEPYTNCGWITGRQGCSDGQIPKLNQRCQSSSPLMADTEDITSMNFQLAGHDSNLLSSTRPSRSLLPSTCPTDSMIPMVNQQIKCGTSFQGATQQVSTLSTCIPNDVEKPPKAQLTIFYSGMVNVYDDVPTDKAQAIMLLAGSGNSLPSSFSPFIPSIGAATSTPANYLTALPDAYQQNHASCSVVSTSFSGILPGTKQQARTAMQSEAQPSRKACLQRFLEKRKDRFRSKVTPYPSSKKPSSYVLPQLYGVPPFKNCERTTSLPTVPQLLPALIPRQGPTQSSGSESSSRTKPPETPGQGSSDDQGTSVENRTSDS